MSSLLSRERLTALLTQIREREREHRAYATVPCQSERRWHADELKAWADELESLVGDTLASASSSLIPEDWRLPLRWESDDSGHSVNVIGADGRLLVMDNELSPRTARAFVAIVNASASPSQPSEIRAAALQEALEAVTAEHLEEPQDECDEAYETAIKHAREAIGRLFHKQPEAGTPSSAPPSQWQPIETAPKDSRVDVLLYGPLGRGVGHWEPPIEQDDEDGNPSDPIPAGWWGERGYWPGESDAQPTHWMPLPACPTLEPCASGERQK